jgi:hypothetical protein
MFPEQPGASCHAARAKRRLESMQARSDVVEVGGEVKDLAGVDAFGEHILDQLGQIGPHGSGTAVHADIADEDSQCRDLDVGSSRPRWPGHL